MSISSFAYAQSVYMHEAQEDAANSEPISAWGIIAFAIFIGFIYLVSKIISEIGNNRKNKKFEAACEESREKKATIKKGGFICPTCGKNVLDDNYVKTTLIFEGNIFKYKYCKSCSDKYIKYSIEEDKYIRSRNKNKELPNWASILLLILMIAIGLFTLIIYCIRGEVLMGIWFMFLTPMFIGGILVGIIKLFQKMFEYPKPDKPFDFPTLEHIRECNALIGKK